MNYRHGDISFHSATLPKGAKKVKEVSSFIVAYGEATGHHHVVKGDTFQIFEDSEMRYFVFTKPVEVSHPEHRTYTIQPGTYRQHQEQEEDPWSEEIRNVID